jgi:hypothetical protein
MRPNKFNRLTHFLILNGLVLGLSACGGGGDSPPADTTPIDEALPLTVQVSVQASEATGNPLAYEWRSSDGEITDVNAATTSWALPAGPGLHFAYVNVSNGKGGYTERRIVVSTDDIGDPSVSRDPVDFDAPAAPAPSGNFYRGPLRVRSYDPDPPDGNSIGVYIPDAATYLAGPYPDGTHSATVFTDSRGYFTFANVQPGLYNQQCASDSSQSFDDCTHTDYFPTPYPGFELVPIGVAPGLDEATTDNYHSSSFSDRDDYIGRVVLQDGSPCGTLNEFFGKDITARVSVLAVDKTVLDGPHRANTWGHYGLSDQPGADSVLIECEGANEIQIPVTDYFDPTLFELTPRTVLADSTLPTVTTMTASLDGSILPATVAKFSPPPSGGLPSDNFPSTDFFLTFKGIDSRKSACQYYLKVGAVKSCDAQGNPGGAITFDDWKRKTKMDPYAVLGRNDIVATYVNKVDLNLTRNHHSLTYGVDQTAAYVCNYLGPSDETQAALDLAIDNAINGRNLVACVAMDHYVTPGVNGDNAFTRFLIFGPSGELLTSVNLDGRAEKFVPGVCVSCHGGDKYAGRFPEDGTGNANIGAHFLPYDSGNFGFSTKAGLTAADQEESIYQLNQNVLLAGPTPATTELINGWYAALDHVLNEDYVPTSWQSQGPNAINYYKKVYARSCRTCHVAFTEELNFDHYSNINFVSPANSNTGIERISVASCNGGSVSFLREYSMPNSLVTMNLYWNSVGTADDQPAITAAFTGDTSCQLDNLPPP